MPRKQGSGSGGRDEYVPYPAVGSADFPGDLVAKAEYRQRPPPDGATAQRIQPAQRFSGLYMSAMTPYRSLLLCHATGMGKTCAAVQVAEHQGSASGKRVLVLAPGSLWQGFEDNVYRVHQGARASAGLRRQCTGSMYYGPDIEGMAPAAAARVQRSKIRKRYEFMGHDRLANLVQIVRDRAYASFKGAGEEAAAVEFECNIRAAFDDRLIVVDEAHELRSDDGAKMSYVALRTVLEVCRSCRLVLMTATPMYDKCTEIVDMVNLMMANEGLEPLAHRDVFDGDAMTAAGEGRLAGALAGRVSYVDALDPWAFPAMIFPREAGAELAAPGWAPPAKTADGREIPADERLGGPGSMELYPTPLSEEQAMSYDRVARTGRAVRSMMQTENVCYDWSRAETNVEAFSMAFREIPGRKHRVVEYARGAPRYLHPDNIDRYAPKIGSAVRLITRSRGLCFLYSFFKASGVTPCAIALEEAGFLPHGREPLLADAPAKGSPSAPRYVVITKDDTDAINVGDVLAVANDPRSGVKVVLGTEIAAQGLDFKRIREVHVLEPWWNISRVRQVIGRGVRRMSHADLPEGERNVTVYLHCTTRGSGVETLDERVYREAFRKDRAVSEVTRVLRRAAVDCGAYPAPPRRKPYRQVSSQGRRLVYDPARIDSNPGCIVKWPRDSERSDSSTVSPYAFRITADLLSFEVVDWIRSRRASTFGDMLEGLGTDEVTLSVSLTNLMNPIKCWRWIGDSILVQRGPVYTIVPASMASASFTTSEAVGALSSKITGI